LREDPGVPATAPGDASLARAWHGGDANEIMAHVLVAGAEGSSDIDIAHAAQVSCIRYASRQAPAHRPVVIGWPGFPGSPIDFFALAPLLARAGHDVLLPIFPGHGVVVPPATWRATFAEYERAAADLLRCFGAREWLGIGHSAGAELMVRGIAASGSRPAAAVFINPWWPSLRNAPLAKRQRRMERVIVRTPRALLARIGPYLQRMMARTFFGAENHWTRAFFDLHGAVFQHGTPRRYRDSYAHAARQTARTQLEVADRGAAFQAADLSALDEARLLLVQTRRDAILGDTYTDQVSACFRERWPQARTFTAETIGSHMVQVESPHAIENEIAAAFA
jgi:pimeloyl-ACP methyl ester carboxylesterase